MKPNFEHITQRLQETLNPSRIYLFGSYAQGLNHSESDVDLLIVVPDDSELAFAKTQRAYHALRGLGVAKDLIVEHESTFQRKINWVSSIEHEVVKNGRILYAQ
jgi:predicted nucleotidyltransferase